MKYLVTGGKGFIGSHLTEALAKDGHEVIVIDDESAPENGEFFEFTKLKKVKYVNKDISDPSTVKLYKGVDVVFHLAARSRIQPAFNEARHTFENNVIGTQCVLEAAVKHGVKRVVYAGSSSFYGQQNAPHRENMTSDCLNPYSLSKYQGEQVCKLYSRMHGIETVVLRYFNVYGPREPLKGRYAPVIGIFKRQKEAGEPLTIVGDGEQRRDFTYVDDVVSANIVASSKSTADVFKKDIPHQVVNVGTGMNYSVNQIADMISDNQVNVPERPGEAQETRADNTKGKLMLGWAPKFKLVDMILKY